MRDFKHLHVYFKDSQSRTGALADYIKSEAFVAEVNRIEQDPKELARLSIALMTHLALDPTWGSQAAAFIVDVGGEDVAFNLHFNRVTNFIGLFSLPRHSIEAQQVVAAIEKNLAGYRFKAARIHRRLDKRFVRLSQQIDKRASAAYEKCLNQHIANGVNFRAWDPEARVQQEAAVEAARHASSAVYRPAKTRLRARIQAVGRKAFDTGYDGGYYDILATFAYQYIQPQF